MQHSNGDLAISMDQALIRRNDVTDDYLHSRANAMQVTLENVKKSRYFILFLEEFQAIEGISIQSFCFLFPEK